MHPTAHKHGDSSATVNFAKACSHDTQDDIQNQLIGGTYL